MQNPFQQAGNTSFDSQDPLAFVKKLWGDMQLPGMVTPNLSLDDLDKQIQDLKTVESWLTLNMNMLRGSIQALEVQRATIAALKTMGESFSKTSHGAAAPSAHASWPMHDKTAATQAEAIDPLLAENEETEEDEAPSNAKSAASDSEPQAANPAAWWTVLQDQFKQALQSAMLDQSSEQTAPSSTATAKAKPKKAAKTSTAPIKKKSPASSSKAKATPATSRAKKKPSAKGA